MAPPTKKKPPRKLAVRGIAREAPGDLAALLADADELWRLEAARAAILERHGWKARLWAKIRRGGPDECWEWTASRRRTGHGGFSVAYDASGSPHRMVWQMVNGPIPAGMFVCHACDNPPCCNPAHLWLGTQGDNNRDSWRKGRGKIPRRPTADERARGEECGSAVLTARTVSAIWRSASQHAELAVVHGVSVETIRAIRRRKTWRHLTDGLGPCAYPDDGRVGVGRQGEKHGNAKLTARGVRSIRAAVGRLSDIATEHGVSVCCVRHVRARRTWKHID